MWWGVGVYCILDKGYGEGVGECVFVIIFMVFMGVGEFDRGVFIFILILELSLLFDGGVFWMNDRVFFRIFWIG